MVGYIHFMLISRIFQTGSGYLLWCVYLEKLRKDMNFLRNHTDYQAFFLTQVNKFLKGTL